MLDKNKEQLLVRVSIYLEGKAVKSENSIYKADYKSIKSYSILNPIIHVTYVVIFD